MCQPHLMAMQTFLLLLNQLAQVAVIHKICTLRGGVGGGQLDKKCTGPSGEEEERSAVSSCVYAINFFRSLKIHRNKVKLGYSHNQMIYFPHTVTKHKLNPRTLLDVVQIQCFLIALCSSFFYFVTFFVNFPLEIESM